MKRVKIVLRGLASTSRATLGFTRFIHGVGHGPSSVNNLCMSMQRCTVSP
jgi:hypothetical protein